MKSDPFKVIDDELERLDVPATDRYALSVAYRPGDSEARVRHAVRRWWAEHQRAAEGPRMPLTGEDLAFGGRARAGDMAVFASLTPAA